MFLFLKMADTKFDLSVFGKGPAERGEENGDRKTTEDNHLHKEIQKEWDFK